MNKTKSDFMERLGLPILACIFILILLGFLANRWALQADDKVSVADKKLQATTEVLKRYEWFLETTINIEETKTEMIRHIWHISALRVLYHLDSIWPAQDIERYNVWSDELVDLNKKYSGLVNEYNSQMEKDGCFLGKKENLPEGANLLLPCKFSFSKKEKNASPLSL